MVISGTAGQVAINQNGVDATYQFYVNGPAGGTAENKLRSIPA